MPGWLRAAHHRLIVSHRKNACSPLDFCSSSNMHCSMRNNHNRFGNPLLAGGTIYKNRRDAPHTKLVIQQHCENRNACQVCSIRWHPLKSLWSCKMYTCKYTGIYICVYILSKIIQQLTAQEMWWINGIQVLVDPETFGILKSVSSTEPKLAVTFACLPSAAQNGFYKEGKQRKINK